MENKNETTTNYQVNDEQKKYSFNALTNFFKRNLSIIAIILSIISIVFSSITLARTNRRFDRRFDEKMKIERFAEKDFNGYHNIPDKQRKDSRNDFSGPSYSYKSRPDNNFDKRNDDGDMSSRQRNSSKQKNSSKRPDNNSKDDGPKVAPEISPDKTINN